MDALSHILISKIMIEIIIIGFDRLNGLIFSQCCVNSVWPRGLADGNQLSECPGSIPRAVIFVFFF